MVGDQDVAVHKAGLLGLTKVGAQGEISASRAITPPDRRKSEKGEPKKGGVKSGFLSDLTTP
jgi:hypothetical protein